MCPLQSPCLTSLLKHRRLIISSKHVSLDFTVVTKPLSLGAYGLRIFNTPLPDYPPLSSPFSKTTMERSLGNEVRPRDHQSERVNAPYRPSNLGNPS